MPQATDVQRKLMEKWFGDPIDDGPPYRFLKARGWSELGGMLNKPTDSYTPSAYEIECVRFLRDEWDYDFQSKGLYFTDVYVDAGLLDVDAEPPYVA